MSFLVDTDIASAHLRGNGNVTSRFLQYTGRVDEIVADRAGEVGAALSEKGFSIATPDLLIAAIALINDVTLATHNVRDFTAIPNLRVADWLQP